jgi:glucose/arabinose dehydrogenase
VGKSGALAAIYTIGNRNVQGIAEHPVTGEIWATEHGPMGGDEVNILKKGANYGWPVITYGVDYDGSVVSKETKKEGMEQPVLVWTPSIAVCPAEFVTGDLFPKWKNNLLVGALAFEEIRRLVLSKV